MASNKPIDIYNTPAGIPPPGQVSNLKDPHYPHRIILLTGVLCLSATTIAVSLHIFTKLHLMKQVRVEDYSLMVAQLGLIPLVTVLLAVPGFGEHFWDISIHDARQVIQVGRPPSGTRNFTYLQPSNQYQNYSLIIYSPVTFFVKLSILLQLRHIFVTSHRQPVFFIIQALICANFTFYIAIFFAEIFACVPRRKIWDHTVPGKCVSASIVLLASGGINIFSDCLILMIPTILVFRLQMALKNKLAVVAVFGSGLFTLISSIARIVYSIKALHTTDAISSGYPIALWAIAEIATIIIATTFPTMPRLWIYIRTGDRNGERSERCPATLSSRKQRQPVNVEHSPMSDDIVPLNGPYHELQDGRKGRQTEELEMQILKTETYEVTSQLKELPEIL